MSIIRTIALLTICLSICSCTRTTPGTAAGCRDQAAREFDAGKYQDAIADLSAAILLEPKDYRAYDMRGRAYTYSNDFKNAEADLNTAMALNSVASSPYSHMGELKLTSGDKIGSLSYVNQAIERNKKDGLAYSVRSFFHLEEKNADAASADAKTAATYCEDDPTDALLAATACIACSKFDEARVCLRKCSEKFKEEGNQEKYEASMKLAQTVGGLQKAIDDVKQAAKQEQQDQMASYNKVYQKMEAKTNDIEQQSRNEVERIENDYKKEKEILMTQYQSFRNQRDRENAQRVWRELNDKTTEYSKKIQEAQRQSQDAISRSQEQTQTELQQVQMEQANKSREASREFAKTYQAIQGGREIIMALISGFALVVGITLIRSILGALLKK